MMNSGNVWQAVGRDGRTFADLDADTVQTAQRGEAFFVCQVVAQEDGASSGKRRFLHEGGNGAAFVETAGFDFDHHLARLDREGPAARRDQRDRQPAHGVGMFGSLAVMDGDADALVFKEQSGGGIHKGLCGVPHDGDLIAINIEAADGAIKAASLGPVQARSGQLQGRKVVVDFSDGTSRDERQGAPGSCSKIAQRMAHGVGQVDEIWARCEID